MFLETAVNSGSVIFSISTVMVVRLVATGSPNKSVCMDTALVSVMLKSSPKTRLPSVRNSNSANKGSNKSLLGGPTCKPSSSNSTGTSNKIVASFFDSNPCSAKASTFSRIFPFNSWLWLIISSIEPYCLMRAFAVFSPMPGMPGILSTASPHKPKISITCNTFSISHFSSTSFTPNISISLPMRAGL